MPKNELFLLKNRRALGVRPPDPFLPADGGVAPRPLLIFGGWRLRPQTFAIPPHDEFLATRAPGINYV